MTEQSSMTTSRPGSGYGTRAIGTPGRSSVYVSFDVEHDRELYERLLVQSGGAGFIVSGRSELLGTTFAGVQIRPLIRDADQLIVICGEHTELSACMATELRIAQEEGRPYFLLWGRRGSMCKKPVGARSADGMYSWTREILQDQVSCGLRRSRALAASERTRGSARES